MGDIMGIGMGWQAQQAAAAPAITFSGDSPPSMAEESLLRPLRSPTVDNLQQQRRDQVDLGGQQQHSRRG